jgi:DNA-binding NarL/FixJ family response regulator
MAGACGDTVNRILIATTEAIFAKGLQGTLSDAGINAPELYTDIRQLHERFLAGAPEVAILDWRLLNGPAALEDLHSAARHCRVVLFVREMPALPPDEFARLGVRAILPISVSPDELIDVVKTVAGAPTRRAGHTDRAVATCSELEKQIISLVSQGMTDSEIGAALEWPQRSVKAAVARLVRRLGVLGRGELALYGLEARNLVSEME